jgi:hypothetical protein
VIVLFLKNFFICLFFLNKNKNKTNNNKTFFTIISFSSPRIIQKSYNIIASSHYLSDVSVENRVNTTALIERFRMFYDSTDILRVFFLVSSSQLCVSKKDTNSLPFFKSTTLVITLTAFNFKVSSLATIK